MTPPSIVVTVLGVLVFILLAAHRPGGPVVIVPGAVETQPFGCTALEFEPVMPACRGGHFHSGIDLAAPAGTAVFAPDGGVASVGAGGPCGIHVVLRHGGGVETLYCHLLNATVADGQPIAAGERIGSVGSSGNSTGPHLHFEVHRDGRAVDPAGWLLPTPVTTKHSGGM
ncbi:MAG: M23 family metallopeptidase [Candidatus Dormibacteraeota bacterium]|nr:M23 family metallopeptidase [Candidatus Dormibacteraeota bacterium]